jgi:Tol biopolymer transport system component
MGEDHYRRKFRHFRDKNHCIVTHKYQRDYANRLALGRAETVRRTFTLGLVMLASLLGATALRAGDHANVTPLWTPVGLRSAASSSTAASGSNVYVLELSTGRIRAVTRIGAAGGSFDSPSWSPGGRVLALSGSPCDDCPDQDTRLYVASPTRTSVQQLPIPAEILPAERPSWNPAGTQLLLIGGLDAAIYRIAADGSNLRKVLGGPAHDEAVWAPDGHRFAFTQQQPNGNWDIYVSDVLRRSVRQLTRTPESEEQPAWSPDGTTIAFSRQAKDGTWSLYVMNADGSNVRPLGPVTHSKLTSSEDPAWAPDGHRLAYVSVVQNRASLFVLDTATGVTRRIHTPFKRSFSPAWSPDGAKLAFVGES